MTQDSVPSTQHPALDVLIIGAGAAGLAAAIFAGEAAAGTGQKIVLLEGAKKPGAKILVSGGGRCNVTNERIVPEDYAGGPRTIIRNVLSAFDEHRTLEWMAAMGVELKLEPAGKYFPVSDKARTVLDALLRRVEEVGVKLISGARVDSLQPDADGTFRVAAGGGQFNARRVIIATGGMALPKSGSDGWGIARARALGHSIVPMTPALVPLALRASDSVGGRFADFAGMTFEARLSLVGERGETLHEWTGSTLFTHFGLSGPSAMNLSRHWLRARVGQESSPSTVQAGRPHHNEGQQSYPVLCIGHPKFTTLESAAARLRSQTQSNPRRTIAATLSDIFPERYAQALALANRPPGTAEIQLGSSPPPTLAHLSRESRLELARAIHQLPLDVVSDRGYAFAETTAGGVDLREINPRTMESRRVPGLFLCGEMLDVDGRIGGFSFQWAWASGYLAGRGAAAR